MASGFSWIDLAILIGKSGTPRKGFQLTLVSRWKSENVSTAAVAEAIGTFPGVQEANVYGVELPCE